MKYKLKFIVKKIYSIEVRLREFGLGVVGIEVFVYVGFVFRRDGINVFEVM